MCNPLMFAAATSMLQQQQANQQIKKQNALSVNRYEAAKARAHQRFAAESGASETEFLQQNEAESQELRRVGLEAAKAAGAVAVRGGPGRPVDALLSDILRAEGEYRASARRQATLVRGGLRRSQSMSAIRAGHEAQAAWMPSTPTTGLLPMLINAGTAGLSMWASTGGNNWNELMGNAPKAP